MNAERDSKRGFRIMTQTFVVVAAGSVIGFIVRDLGDAAISGWIIQVRLLLRLSCRTSRLLI